MHFIKVHTHIHSYMQHHQYSTYMYIEAQKGQRGCTSCCI